MGTQNNIQFITHTKRRIHITHVRMVVYGLMGKGTEWELEIKDNEWKQRTKTGLPSDDHWIEND